jgi:hypothetical protein
MPNLPIPVAKAKSETHLPFVNRSVPGFPTSRHPHRFRGCSRAFLCHQGGCPISRVFCEMWEINCSLPVALGISLGAEVQTVKIRDISHISRQRTSRDMGHPPWWQSKALEARFSRTLFSCVEVVSFPAGRQRRRSTLKNPHKLRPSKPTRQKSPSFRRAGAPRAQHPDHQIEPPKFSY